MSPITYSQDAKSDLISIGRYLVDQAGHEIASVLLKRIRDRVEAIPSFPSSNPLVPEAGQSVRRLLVGRYLILYRVEVSTIVIVRVLHSSQSLSAALLSR